jgi:putative secretion ATPase (PEP-CTERM system associated)
MYTSYFRFKEKPFDIVPNPAYLYLSRTHKKAMTYMRYGLQERLGFVLMTGEVGSGKTLLVRELIRTLSPEITFARVFNTRVSSEELIAMINEDFGLDTAGRSKVLMLKDLYAHLIHEYAEGRRPLLIIDEAQNLSLDLLEEVRMLSNLETNDAKLLQILLVGQTELDRVLSLNEMRQFRQRISIACRIENLTRAEVEEYILHRLSVAGNREALTFGDEAFNAVHEVTSGVPRQINTLCNFLLLTAFTEGRRDASAEMVRDIAAGLNLTKYTDPNGSKGKQQGTARMASGNGSLDGKRALLRALGVMLRDHNGSANSVASAEEDDDVNEYPVTVRSIGLRLLAMEKELARIEEEYSNALKQRLDALETQVLRPSSVQRPVQQDIATAPPAGPYCDLPNLKDPRIAASRQHLKPGGVGEKAGPTAT